MRLMVVFDLLCCCTCQSGWSFLHRLCAVTYLLARPKLIGHVKKFRKGRFVLCCFYVQHPVFFLHPDDGVFSFLPVGVVMVGIARNMLKAIDAVFFRLLCGAEDSVFNVCKLHALFPVLTAGPIFPVQGFVKTYENPDPITAPLIENASSASSAACLKRWWRRYLSAS